MTGDRFGISTYNKIYFKKLLYGLVPYLAPMFVFIVIWIPVINHYYVPTVVVTDEMLDTARRLPGDSLLIELKQFSLTSNRTDGEEQLIGAAEKILHGSMEIPGFPRVKIAMPFDVNDINKGLPGWQLELASLAIPKIFLAAYEVSRREDFFRTATEVILAWASYERSAWMPKGFLWNDHAIAARILVLAEFWRLYRGRPDYQPEVAEAIFQLVARSGEFLAKEGHFTFSTNHGVMQNLALLHLSLAFPTLPNVDRYRQLALNRIRDQMTFYINDEGVVLEHSAGYQEMGLQLISIAFRYLTLMNVKIPDDWRIKFDRAKNFYVQLRRPDGSLPVFGDTSKDERPVSERGDRYRRREILSHEDNWIPTRSHSLYPVAGYSIWWDGLEAWPDIQRLKQTAVVWSYFPGHAHKHADEMSLLLWAGGREWLTSVGYWPYGTNGRFEAEAWGGSNAPHLAGESPYSARRTFLRFYGWSDNLSFLDLERKGPQEYVARRQVIHVTPTLWIVVDSTIGKQNNRTTTTWTTSHEVELSRGKLPGSYYLTDKNNPSALMASIFGSSGIETKQFWGSFSPFAGWEVVEQTPRPAPAIVVEGPANGSWTVAIFGLHSGIGGALEFTGQPYMEYWETAEKWKIVLPLKASPFSISREGSKVHVDGRIRDGSPRGLTLIEGPDPRQKRSEIRSAYEDGRSKYPIFADLLSYRLKATYILIFIFFLQEPFFFVYKKIIGKYYGGLRMLNVFGWVGVGMWLVLVYFSPR